MKLCCKTVCIQKAAINKDAAHRFHAVEVCPMELTIFKPTAFQSDSGEVGPVELAADKPEPTEGIFLDLCVAKIDILIRCLVKHAKPFFPAVWGHYSIAGEIVKQLLHFCHTAVTRCR